MEYKINDGKLLTFDKCTAASNIPAGTPVAFLTATTLIYTLSSATVSASMGHHFVGITDKAYSAMESPVTVWTEGVFNLIMATDMVSADCEPGWPVFGRSGVVVNVGTATLADAAIGTLVSRPAECTGVGGVQIKVKINPAVYRWTTYLGAPGPGGVWTSATCNSPLCWPIAKGHA